MLDQATIEAAALRLHRAEIRYECPGAGINRFAVSFPKWVG